MMREALQALLRQVAAGDVGVEQATAALRDLPYTELGFARVDHHRALRQGTPEVIFGSGKTPDHVLAIAVELIDHGSNVMCTRVGASHFEAVRERYAEAVFHRDARMVTLVRHARPAGMGCVGVACAGTSDLPVAEEASVALDFFGAQVARMTDVGVAGLHRLHDVASKFRDVDAVIVVAGMEGALPSVLGGLLACPVIAVPTSVGYGAHFGGLTPLLAMLNACAAGVTVVNIDNGFGAAAAAHRILLRMREREREREHEREHEREP